MYRSGAIHVRTNTLMIKYISFTADVSVNYFLSCSRRMVRGAVILLNTVKW